MAKDEVLPSGTEPTRCELPAQPTLEAVQAVSDVLLRARGSAVHVCAEHVGRVSASLIQVLICAREEWSRAQHPFQIANPSDAFRDGIALLGLEDDFFEMVDAA